MVLKLIRAFKVFGLNASKKKILRKDNVHLKEMLKLQGIIME